MPWGSHFRRRGDTVPQSNDSLRKEADLDRHKLPAIVIQNDNLVSALEQKFNYMPNNAGAFVEKILISSTMEMEDDFFPR